MKTRLFAILVVAFTLCVVNMEGAVIPPQEPVLPSELPIGSRQRMIDWAVTNRLCSFSMSISFTNNSNQNTNRGISSPPDGIKFESYQAYKDCLVTNGVNLYNTFKSTMKPGSTLKVWAVIMYLNLNAVGLYSDTNVGPASLVTSNVFRSIEPNIVTSVLSISNLQRFSITAESLNGQKYRYSWTLATGGVVYSPIPSPFPQELTRKDAVVINELIGTHSGRLRYELGGYTITNNYTEVGNYISSRFVSIDNNKVVLTVAKKADVCIQSSSDLSSWTSVTNILSCSTNVLSIPLSIDKNAAMRFYRAVSW